jgi:hypothetical protein
MNDVAARDTGIVQIAIAPLGQFPARTLTLAPNMHGFLNLRPKPGTMMIYHRLV